MHSEDAMELRLTWAEAQELLRPPPSVTPTIVMIEDQEFEEYDVSKSSWQLFRVVLYSGLPGHLFGDIASLKFIYQHPAVITYEKEATLNCERV